MLIPRPNRSVNRLIKHMTVAPLFRITPRIEHRQTTLSRRHMIGAVRRLCTQTVVPDSRPRRPLLPQILSGAFRIERDRRNGGRHVLISQPNRGVRGTRSVLSTGSAVSPAGEAAKDYCRQEATNRVESNRRQRIMKRFAFSFVGALWSIGAAAGASAHHSAAQFDF